MALDNAAIDQLVDQLREAARAHRATFRPQIVESYKQLVALPPAERAAERKKRAAGLMDYIHQNVPATDPDNAKLAMSKLREGLVQLVGDQAAVDGLTDDQLTRLVTKWRHAVEQDTHDEIKGIMQEAGATPPAAHRHVKRPHIGI
jgi:hypothetical protein